MAYTTIDDPTIYFNTKLYTGNGSTGHVITGVGFQPDWVWLKNRNTTNTHEAFDSVRGATKTLYPDRSDAEYVNATGSLTSFNSDGFTVGSGDGANKSGSGIASWNWKAGGSASSNTDGSITSTVSANTTAGFSIVSYTGTGANATVGHGLGVAPKMFIVKNRSTATNWHVYHHKNTSAPETDYLLLNTTNATADNSIVWNDTAPTSSVFSIGTTDGTNKNTSNMIAYCFAEKKGYSKFGSYTGNGTNNNGTFFYCGFSPSVVIIKASSSSRNWVILDNKRLGYNDKNYRLFPNLTNAEDTTSGIIDFTANGFKLMSNNNTVNESGVTYIVMAFAESPFVNSNGAVPTNAR